MSLAFGDMGVKEIGSHAVRVKLCPIHFRAFCGNGRDVTISEFAQLVAEVVGYRGQLIFDTSRPDGAPQKLLDVSKLANLGWRAKTSLQEGIAMAYADFLAGGGRYR